ncbi:MAG: YggT family protein [Anaerolineae bacterium]
MIVSGVITVVNAVFQLAALAILARVILSWLPMAGVRIDPYNPLIRFLFRITDPILDPIRRFATFGMVDFSPIVALILLEVVRRVVVGVLVGSL